MVSRVTVWRASRLRHLKPAAATHAGQQAPLRDRDVRVRAGQRDGAAREDSRVAVGAAAAVTTIVSKTAATASRVDAAGQFVVAAADRKVQTTGPAAAAACICATANRACAPHDASRGRLGQVCE